MKSFLGGILLSLAVITSVRAAHEISYFDEVYALGSVAGQGLACRAERYDDFEMLARAILIGKAKDADMQNEGLQAYNRGKVGAFMELESEQFASCAEINQNFNSQKIFKSVLYSDGRMQLYDGTLVTPRKTYNVNKLYQKDPYAFAKADAAYKKYLAEAQKNSKNAKKIPLRDSNYSKYANQFQ